MHQLYCRLKFIVLCLTVLVIVECEGEEASVCLPGVSPPPRVYLDSSRRPDSNKYRKYWSPIIVSGSLGKSLEEFDCVVSSNEGEPAVVDLCQAQLILSYYL